jgi:hypothetical protein
MSCNPAHLTVLYCPGGRALFSTKKDGRGKQPRGTFFGFIAVSQPLETLAPPAATTGAAAGAEQGRDVALVWRGTVFREEWESNFAQDELVRVKHWWPQ